MKDLSIITLLLILGTACSRFPANSCVNDKKVGRIYKVSGEKGDSLLVEVLITGSAVPGSYEVGSQHAIPKDDSQLELIPCPKQN